jgi:hypothetical protein
MIESLMLFAIALSSPRLDVEVQGKDCVIKTIVFDGVNSYVHAMGNCDIIYDKCLEDNCDVQDYDFPDLNFGKKNVG